MSWFSDLFKSEEQLWAEAKESGHARRSEQGLKPHKNRARYSVDMRIADQIRVERARNKKH